MIIDPDVSVFPSNAVIVIRNCLQTIDPAFFVTTRQLRSTDPNEAAGVFPMLWTPVEESYETRGNEVVNAFPTVQRYTIGVQGVIKDPEEVRGLNRHAALTKMIRVMLYRDPTLVVALRSLSVGNERFSRFGIRTQRYLSNDISGVWLYVSTFECWLETETS